MRPRKGCEDEDVQRPCELIQRYHFHFKPSWCEP